MPPVTNEAIGRRIADARARAGLTQLGLAQAIGLDRSALAKVETGARRITALELARVAEETGESFDWFVTDPPQAVVSYRMGTDAVVTSAIDRLVERAARDVELLQSLGQLDTPTLEPFGQFQELRQAETCASEARTILGLDQTTPITDLVEPLAKIGLFTFSEPLGVDTPDAATTLLERGGVTVINSDRAVGRRRLALAHELGHFMLADEYTVDWRIGAWTDASRAEWLIDAFARAFLLPTASVRTRWAELKAHGASVRDAAIRIGSEYRVDMSTLASRLAELTLEDGDSLSVIRNTTTTRADIIEYDLVVARDLAGTTLPRRYEKAVLSLYRAERISAARAVDLLRDTLTEAGLPALPPVDANEIWKFVS